MSDKFDILNNDLKRLRANGSSFGVFGEDAHGYELHVPLLEDEVSMFESEHGIRLPDDYRLFLIRVGNGGAGPYYDLFRFGERDDGFGYAPWKDFVGRLSSLFPHNYAWNDLTGKPEDDAARDSEEYENLMEAFEQRYYDSRQVDGAIPICHLGCARRQWLVISGPEAGNMWCDDRADCGGLYPLQTPGRVRTSFFQWYRDWLDEVLSKVQRAKSGSSAPNQDT
jgi:hypothetical protein